MSDAPADDLPDVRPHEPFAEPKRDRVPDEREVRLLVRALEGLAWQFAALILLLLLTGQRPCEVAEVRWAVVGLAKRKRTIPGECTKNKRRHLVPLGRQVIRLLKSLPTVGAEHGIVLTTSGRTPISGFSKAKEALDALMDRATNRPIPDRVAHDLRPTFATRCRLAVR